MAILFEKNNAIGLVTPNGALSTDIAESFRKQFVTWFESSPEINRVVIDLGGVPYMDSSGLGAVIGILKRSVERGGTLTLARPTNSVKLVLKITGADRIIKVCGTLEEAVE